MRIRAAQVTLGAIAACLALTLLAVPVHAEDEGWIITSFDSGIVIQPDAVLQITEDIRVDFQGLQKHGIFRTIPLRYRYSDTQDRYYDLNVMSVTDGLRPVPFDAYIESDNQVIKIGDPDRTITGRQRYVITYSVAGAMNSFDDHDELFWNVDGALWPVPKQTVTATVIYPRTAFLKAACYQGAAGSREPCQVTGGIGPNVAFASTRQLASGEQMSVAVSLAKGAVNVPPPLLEAKKREFPQDAFDITPFTVALSLLVLVGGVGLVARNWWLHGRDRAYLTQFYLTQDPRERTEPLFIHDPLVVEFEVPGT